MKMPPEWFPKQLSLANFRDLFARRLLGRWTLNSAIVATSVTVAQLFVASVAGLASVAIWYQIKKRQPGDPSVRSQRSVNLDVGEIIQVDAWLPDGSAQVMYRGASWSVIQRPGNAPVPGSYRVTELVGSRLLVEKV